MAWEEVQPPPALSRARLDRAGGHRGDDGWLAAAWADPRARVLVLCDGQAAVTDDDPPVLVLTGPAQAATSVPTGPRLFLGLADGAPHWAVTAARLPEVPGTHRAGLREVGALLDDRDSALLVQAVGLANWHATHPRCPRCGAATQERQGGHVRVCVKDGSTHFPRTDPAVIMLVHDGGDRCLLGRQPSWPARRYSTLAGFVEPGESAELAVAREVAEEVEVAVTEVRYVASQPWPFPSSLMLGFTARAVPGGQDPRPADDELVDARWFARAELAAEVAAGRLALPPPVSIAWRLITDWLGGQPGERG